MGISWRLPVRKTVTGNLFISAKFPINQKRKQNLFNLWTYFKQELKDDGFSLTKNKYDNEWYIYYFWTPPLLYSDEDSSDEDSSDGNDSGEDNSGEDNSDENSSDKDNSFLTKHTELLEKYQIILKELNYQL